MVAGGQWFLTGSFCPLKTAGMSGVTSGCYTWRRGATAARHLIYTGQHPHQRIKWPQMPRVSWLETLLSEKGTTDLFPHQLDFEKALVPQKDTRNLQPASHPVQAGRVFRCQQDLTWQVTGPEHRAPRTSLLILSRLPLSNEEILMDSFQRCNRPNGTQLGIKSSNGRDEPVEAGAEVAYGQRKASRAEEQEACLHVLPLHLHLGHLRRPGWPRQTNSKYL